MKRNKQIDIKRALTLAGIFNFLCSCARGCVLPFLTLYFRQLGLTPAMTGIIMGTKHLISLVWSPTVSILSKHYNKRRVVINGSLLCSAAVALILLLVPSSGVHTQSSVCDLSNVSSSPAQTLSDNLHKSTIGPEASLTKTLTKGLVSQPGETVPAQTTTKAKSSPVAMSKTPNIQHGDESHTQPSQETVSVVVNNSVQEPNITTSVVHHSPSSTVAAVRKKRSKKRQEEKTPAQERHFEFLGYLKVMDPQHQLFFLILIIVSVWEALLAPLEWTADDGLYEYLDFADASDRYRSTGLWGLLGAACGAGGAGLLVSQLSCLIAGQTPRSTVHFYCYSGFAALALPAANYLPLHLNKKRDRASGLLKALQLVRGSPRALLCTVTTLLVGAAVAAVDNFLLWQMQDHGSTELHMGLSVALALLSQAAFPLLSGRVSKLLSPGKVLAAAAAVLSLQCLYFSFLWGAWAAPLAQMWTCFSSGALWWAVNAQCEDVATLEAERSVRRVYSGLALHLGGSLGSFAGGYVVQTLGLAWLFRGVAVGLAAWCVCLLLLQWKAPHQRRINYSRLLAANGSEASDSESDWLDKAFDDDKSNKKYGRRINH
ncbi:major facilitator superfamily domain-containing protein 6-like [Solea solea]|uniref:major facilitator superfamily domain-containing protein 6-like n=1 Tax=Solea solea TaxID=90069 RepID=UPI002729D186|nr:major facilitator superfamily domain-containing protein 6-like [Solea solea]